MNGRFFVLIAFINLVVAVMGCEQDTFHQLVQTNPSLVLDFTKGILPAGLAFTRKSTGTYMDETGDMQVAKENEPRFDYDPVTHFCKGLLIEESRTNLLLNSAHLPSQTVSVKAQPYTLSTYGPCTVTTSGAASITLVGTSSVTRNSVTFTTMEGLLR